MLCDYAQQSTRPHHCEKRVVGEREGEGIVDFVRFSLPNITASANTNQLHPIETTAVTGWLRPCAFRKRRGRVPCTYCSAFGMLDRQILSSCICRAVTGDLRLHQTAKSWFRGCLMYRKSSLSTPLILNHTTHGAISSLFRGCLTFISDTVLVSSRVHTEHGG